jgi:hypothetical protein
MIYDTATLLILHNEKLGELQNLQVPVTPWTFWKRPKPVTKPEHKKVSVKLKPQPE